MKFRLNLIHYDSKVYVWDARDQVLNKLLDSSGEMEKVLDVSLCSLVIKQGVPISQEDAWRLVLKSEGKPTTLECNTCSKVLQLYKDPVCSAYRGKDKYVDLCEQCFREEYKGIAEPMKEPYPKPPVDLEEPYPNPDFTHKFITHFIEDPPWALKGLRPPPKDRPIRILNHDAYALKHHWENK